MRLDSRHPATARHAGRAQAAQPTPANAPGATTDANVQATGFASLLAACGVGEAGTPLPSTAPDVAADRTADGAAVRVTDMAACGVADGATDGDAKVDKGSQDTKVEDAAHAELMDFAVQAGLFWAPPAGATGAARDTAADVAIADVNPSGQVDTAPGPGQFPLESTRDEHTPGRVDTAPDGTAAAATPTPEGARIASGGATKAAAEVALTNESGPVNDATREPSRTAAAPPNPAMQALVAQEATGRELLQRSEPRERRADMGHPLGALAELAFAPPNRHDVPAATATTGLRLSTPVDHEDFGAALSLQVSALVREGVHDARMQLNPIDMGPISIRIELDGREAQVHFAAAEPATRELLHASLPALEQALQSDGLQLAGSSVGDSSTPQGQARDPRSGAQPGDGAPARNWRVPVQADLVGTTVAPRAPRATVGALDLYA